jgi:hypothetical protein
MRHATRPPSCPLVVFALCAILVSATRGRAEPELFWQYEIGQGLQFASGPNPYTFSAQFHPSLGLGEEPRNFLVAASLAAMYDNPGWSALWGGRTVIYVTKLRKAPLDGGPSIPYGTLHLVAGALLSGVELRRVSGGFVADIVQGSLLLTPQVGYDFDSERTFVELGLGMGY